MEEVTETVLKTAYRQIRNKLKNTNRNFKEDSEELIQLINNSITKVVEGNAPDKFQALTFDAMGVISKRMRVSSMINEGEIYRSIFNVAQKACEALYFSPKQVNLILQWKEEMEKRLEKGF